MTNNRVHIVNKSPDHIGALTKGLRILEAFNATHPRLSIAQAAAATGLDRATARRCLLTLHDEGYADYDGKYFRLAPRALRLGTGVIQSLPLPQIVQPWLDHLTARIGQSCSVALLDGTEIVYVARAAQRRVMSIGLMPGSRLPAHCTSLGRVLLAALPPDQAREIVTSSDLTPRTPHSRTDPAEIMALLRQVARDGYALVDQEIEIGLRSLAVPLFDSKGEVIAALNTGMAAVQNTADDLLTLYLPDLQKTQEGLQRHL